MRTAIEREFPGDAILGEEFGLQRGLGGRTWIIDPIDRTESYIAGGDSWGLHIALQAHDQIVVAALTRPTANSIWLAVAGGGAFVGNIEIAPREGRRLWVSSQSDVGQARVGGDIPPDSKALDVLKRSCVYDADEPCVVGAVAQGRLDACLDEGGKPWDLAPGILIVTEAGGRFVDRSGGMSAETQWGLYANPYLSAELQDLLRGTIESGT